MDSPIKSSVSPTKQWAIKRNPKGFTLIEILIALTILTLVLTGAYSTFFTFSRSMKNSMEHLDQAAETQYTFQNIHKEMRAISDTHSAGDKSFEFTTTHMDGSKERIRYYYDASVEIFYRYSVTNNETRDLMHNVKSVDFDYFDREGNESSSLSDINAAKLNIKKERNITSGTLETQSESATVTFRNKSL